MALTTRDIVKSVLKIGGETYDTLIDQSVAAASQWIANHCRRRFEREVERVEYPRGGGPTLQLTVYPVESISEIKQATDLDFDAADALVEDDDFVLQLGGVVESNVGVIEHRYGQFYPGANVVRVTYTGGYWTGDAEELPAGALQLPDVVAEAAKLMAVHLFSNRDKLGARHISAGSMDISEVRDGMLRTCIEQLQDYVNYG